MTRPSAFLAVLLLACGACSRGARQSTPAAAPPPAAANPEGDSYVTSTTSLRREPVEAQRVKALGGGSPNSNLLAVLQRGERVTALEHRGDWAHVRASDGTEGWLRSSLLLPADGVTEGTVLAQAWAFDRPDLLAVNVTRKVDPGTLLLVVKTKELFSEVDLGQGQNAWILSDRISTQPADVMAAKLVEKARALARGGHPAEAREVLGLLRARLPDSPLAALLALDLGEGGADGGAADGGPPPLPAPPPPVRDPLR